MTHEPNTTKPSKLKSDAPVHIKLTLTTDEGYELYRAATKAGMARNLYIKEVVLNHVRNK